MEEFVLALDLGGTNARFAAVSNSGEIVARRREKTPDDSTGEALAGFLVEQFRLVRADLGADSHVFAAAAAIPAVFDDVTGIPVRLPNMPELERVDLAAILAQGLEIPITLANDATAATIGEHWLGASKGFDNVIGVTLGTGVGGGLIIDGEPFHGKNGSAGEIGHIGVEPDGHECGCGSRGCVEQYASGSAIVQEAARRKLNAKTPRDVFDFYRDGDEAAREIFESVGRYLGIALAGCINILNPDIIVIGGGVAASWEAFIEPLKDEVAFRAAGILSSRVEIVPAQLGDNAGLLGAAEIAFGASRPC